MYIRRADRRRRPDNPLAPCRLLTRPAGTVDPARNIEVETYTWSVLPEQERPANDEALAAAMAREIAFIVGNTPADVRIAGRPD